MSQSLHRSKRSMSPQTQISGRVCSALWDSVSPNSSLTGQEVLVRGFRGSNGPLTGRRLLLKLRRDSKLVQRTRLGNLSQPVIIYSTTHACYLFSRELFTSPLTYSSCRCTYLHFSTLVSSCYFISVKFIVVHSPFQYTNSSSKCSSRLSSSPLWHPLLSLRLPLHLLLPCPPQHVPPRSTFLCLPYSSINTDSFLQHP